MKWGVVLKITPGVGSTAPPFRQVIEVGGTESDRLARRLAKRFAKRTWPRSRARVMRVFRRKEV